jgi:hypothetical protein
MDVFSPSPQGKEAALIRVQEGKFTMERSTRVKNERNKTRFSHVQRLFYPPGRVGLVGSTSVDECRKMSGAGDTEERSVV